MLAILELQKRTEDFQQESRREVTVLRRKERKLQKDRKKLELLDEQRRNRKLQQEIDADRSKYMASISCWKHPPCDRKHRCQERVDNLKLICFDAHLEEKQRVVMQRQRLKVAKTKQERQKIDGKFRAQRKHAEDRINRLVEEHNTIEDSSSIR
jgi:hypothetical protein